MWVPGHCCSHPGPLPVTQICLGLCSNLRGLHTCYFFYLEGSDPTGSTSPSKRQLRRHLLRQAFPAHPSQTFPSVFCTHSLSQRSCHFLTELTGIRRCHGFVYVCFSPLNYKLHKGEDSSALSLCPQHLAQCGPHRGSRSIC